MTQMVTCALCGDSIPNDDKIDSSGWRYSFLHPELTRCVKCCSDDNVLNTTEIETLKELHAEPLKGENNGLLNSDREINATFTNPIVNLMYHKLTDNFTLHVQCKGKVTCIILEYSQGLTLLNVFDSEAYAVVMKMRGNTDA